MIWLFLGLFLILHDGSDADDNFFSSDGRQDTKEKEEEDETSLPASDSKLGHEFDPGDPKNISAIKGAEIPLTAPDVIYNDCSANMVENGVYVCENCFTAGNEPEKVCYIFIEANSGGKINLEFNVTEIITTGGHRPRIALYDGFGGANILRTSVYEAGVYTFEPSGASAFILLSASTVTPPRFSFFMKFSTVGQEIMKTAGCGGVVRDHSIVHSPGYQVNVTKGHNCMWVYSTPEGTSAYFSLLQAQMMDKGVIHGSLRIFDGLTTADRLIAQVYQGYDDVYEAKSGKMLLHYEIVESGKLSGFLGWLKPEPDQKAGESRITEDFLVF